MLTSKLKRICLKIFSSTNFIVAAFLILGAVVNQSYLPKILLGFPNGSNGLNDIRVLLPDDVMITLRAAQGIANFGYPSLNQYDLSQPATSYLLPYLLAPFYSSTYPWIMPLVAIILGIFSLIGICRLSTTGLNIKKKIYIIALILLNSTVLSYAYSGWEHLEQGFLVVITFWLFSDKCQVRFNHVLAGLFCALSVLMRIDSLLIFTPLLFWAVINIRNTGCRRFITVFMVIGLLAIFFQLNNYHWLLPTTARLKAGAVVDFVYLLTYFSKNVLHFTILTVSLVIIPIIYSSRYKIGKIELMGLYGSILSIIYAIIVSDVFPYARMFLCAGLLLIYIFACIYGVSNKNSKYERVILFLVSGAVLIIGFQSLGKSVIVSLDRINLPTIEHTYIAHDLKPTLLPNDSVGLFWLGAASYELNGNKIADFLGKGDELIANSSVKWGPPGHNKWNIDDSIQKWNPVIIIARSDVANDSEDNRRKRIENHQNWSFWDDLYENEKVKRDYLSCKYKYGREFLILIRKDRDKQFSKLCID